MDKRCQQLFKGKRVEFPLATGAASHISLVYDEKKNPYLLCFTSMHEEKAEFSVPLNGCRIINNITEIGPCIHIITAYEEYQFQCSSKEEFNVMSQFFNLLGFPILSFKNVYVLNEKIGKGSFSTAYIGTNTLYGNKVVIKEVDKSKVKESNVYTEIEVLRKVMHKYIIKLISAYEQDGYVYLVLEYLKGGELFEYLNNNGPYSETNARKAMKRILIALETLHTNGVVHRDLKMENLMLEQPDDPCSLKIIDFGLASFLNTPSMSMRCGSPGYVAPEILKYAPYDTKVDIFSLGVILYNILSGYPPFRGTNVREIFKKNVRCHISFNSKHWSDKSNCVKEIILWMCSKNPDDRCTAIQALGHPWFLPKLTDMYMNKAVEGDKSKDINSTTNSNNGTPKITEQQLRQLHKFQQLQQHQDMCKRCKHYNIDHTNVNNESNNSNGNSNGNGNGNGNGSSSTRKNLNHKNNEGKQNGSTRKNSKNKVKSYKNYFDTLLKIDDRHTNKKLTDKNRDEDREVNTNTHNRKQCGGGFSKNGNEYEKVALHGKSPIVSTNNMFPLTSSILINKKTPSCTLFESMKIESIEQIENKKHEEELEKGEISTDIKRYVENY